MVEKFISTDIDDRNRKEDIMWCDGLTDKQIDRMKKNWFPVRALKELYPDLYDALSKTPYQDRMILSISGEWVEDDSISCPDGVTFRLREGWKRPELDEVLRSHIAHAKRMAPSVPDSGCYWTGIREEAETLLGYIEGDSNGGVK